MLSVKRNAPTFSDPSLFKSVNLSDFCVPIVLLPFFSVKKMRDSLAQRIKLILFSFFLSHFGTSVSISTDYNDTLTLIVVIHNTW